MSEPRDSTTTNNVASPSQKREASTLETVPTTNDKAEKTFPPNTPFAASLTSFLLGGLFFVGSWTVINNSGLLKALISGEWSAVAVNQPSVQLAFFLTAWGFFHWAEFAVTAGWNREKCSTSSFLLDNGTEYHVAHTVAILEFITTSFFFPDAKRWPFVTPLGMLVVLLGQLVRSGAMISAANNFSHIIQYKRQQDHQLVTSGIYSWSRHPSYAGFFYWGIGTQIALQNPISFLGYAIVLYRFFYHRIKYEERLLVLFFGKDYEAYRARVPTRIPFLR
ncbi:ICMT-domain-containing protein [Serendipita vermifera]|nr:ICMT-domain-containing protein [Serendipita vermifera]